jgi:hypothetical protein
VGLELVPLCTFVIELADPVVLPATPAGTRVIVEVNDFRVEGDRLQGKKKGNAHADWLTIGPDGTGTMDVRATVETEDGCVVFVTYQGRRDFSRGLDAPMYVTPRFEAGDDRYSWLHKIQAVAKGTMDGTTLTYEVYELV